MRGAVALVMVAGACGRIGFDALDAALPPAAWLPNFTYRKAVTIHAATSTTLASFPVSLLTTDPDLPNANIVITDASGETELPLEIVAFDPASHTLEAWVAPASLPPGETTLYLYYDGPAEPHTSPWSGGFVGAWHMVLAGGAVADSAGGHTVSGSGSAIPASAVGIVGSAAAFDGVSSELSIADPPDGSLDFGTQSFSFSVWVDVTQSVGMYDIPIYKGGGSPCDNGYDMELGTHPWKTGIADGSQKAEITFGMESQFLGGWVQLVTVVDRGSSLLVGYVNGAAVPSTDISAIGSVDSTTSFRISDAQSAPFNGLIDEPRVYNRALSADWVALEYANLARRSQTVTFGAQETQTP